jgi:heme exporter protein CcmD
MTGVIHGGWGYVWAAYAITATVFTTYAVSVILRYRAELRRAARERERGKAS